jgi:transaldolase
MQHEGRQFSAEEDPGVLAVTRIYNYYKKCARGVQLFYVAAVLCGIYTCKRSLHRHNFPTTVMAASFRNPDEVSCVCVCMTVSITR